MNVSTDKGENQLGKLLEKIRSEIKQGDDLNKWIKSKFTLLPNDGISISVMSRDDRNEVISTESKIVKNSNVLLIGKHPENDIIVSHPSVSRTHAMVIADCNKGLVLLDMESTHGTRIDGTAVKPYYPTIVLKSNEIQFGESTNKFQIDIDNKKIEHIQRQQKEKLYDKVSTEYDYDLNSILKENTVFVGNIAYTVTESKLREFFSECGNIVSINLPADKATGKIRGIAFITFENISNVTKALFRNEDEFEGRKIKIKRVNDLSKGLENDKRNSSSNSIKPSLQPDTRKQFLKSTDLETVKTSSRANYDNDKYRNDKYKYEDKAYDKYDDSRSRKYSRDDSRNIRSTTRDEDSDDDTHKKYRTSTYESEHDRKKLKIDSRQRDEDYRSRR